MKRYAVTVERDDPHWLIRVPEIDRVTQARSLREVDTVARDLISIMTNAVPDSFDIELKVELPEPVRAHLAESQRLAELAANSRAQSAREVRLAARSLQASGLTVRDIGAALGISYQRAHQLVTNTPRS